MRSAVCPSGFICRCLAVSEQVMLHVSLFDDIIISDTQTGLFDADGLSVCLSVSQSVWER